MAAFNPINWLIRIVLCVLIVWTVFRLIKIISKLNYHKRELKYAKRLKNLPDAEIVSGKVIDIHEEKLTQWDILYTLNVVYAVDEAHYMRKILLLNKGSVRMGTELRLIADKGEPQNAVAEDGSQADIIRICKSYLIRHIILLVWAVVGVFCFFRFGIEDIELND